MSTPPFMWLGRHTSSAILSLICPLVSGCLFSACTYMPTPWDVPDSLTLTETRERLVLVPKDGSPLSTGLMFYQGGLVDPHAYLPALAGIAEAGVAVVIPKVIGNLAAFDQDIGLRHLDAVPGVEQWVLSGHSLGSAMAAYSVHDHPDVYVGLMLMAGVTTEDAPLDTWERPVLCITASRDGVLRDQVDAEERALLPPGFDLNPQNEGYPDEIPSGYTAYRIIEGGNHAQFGSYGAQDGDNEPTISEEEQHRQITEAFLTFLEKNQWYPQ